MKYILFFNLLFLSTGLAAVELHYFGQVVAAKTSIEDESLLYDGIANKVTLGNLTSGGINFGHQFGSNSTVIMQTLLFEENVNLDLLQFKYNHERIGTTRIGRQRLPFFWFSENVQVNALLPWIDTPREVYAKIPIYSFTGASIEKSFDRVGFNLYAGHVKEKLGDGDIEYDANANNSIGLRIDAKLGSFKFFANYNRGETKLSIKSSISNTTPQGSSLGYTQNYDLGQFEIFTAGLSFDLDRMKLYSELLYTTTENGALKQTLSYYVSPVYTINDSWQAVATFSRDHEAKTNLFPSKTSTLGLNLNYFFDLSNVFKIGVEQINFKRVSVASPSLAGTSNSGVYAMRPPGKNFNIFAASWSFVY